MKYFRVFLILFSLWITTQAMAATDPRCPGEEGYFFTNYRLRNPTKGGFVSNEAYINDSDAMIFIGPEVAICGSSDISDKAKIYGKALVRASTISGNARIYGNAKISKGAEIFGNARVYGAANLRGSVIVCGDAIVAERAKIFNDTEDYLVKVKDRARVTGDAIVTGNAIIKDRARVQGHSKVSGEAVIGGTIVLKGYPRLSSGIHTSGTLNPPEPQNEIDERHRLQRQKEEQARQHKLALQRAKEAEELLKYIAKIRSLTISDFLGFNGIKVGEKWQDEDFYKNALGGFLDDYGRRSLRFSMKDSYPYVRGSFTNDNEKWNNRIKYFWISLSRDIKYNKWAEFGSDNRQLILLGSELTGNQLKNHIKAVYVGCEKHEIQAKPSYVFQESHYFISNDYKYVLEIEQRSTNVKSPKGRLIIENIRVYTKKYFDTLGPDGVGELFNTALKQKKTFIFHVTH